MPVIEKNIPLPDNVGAPPHAHEFLSRMEVIDKWRVGQGACATKCRVKGERSTVPCSRTMQQNAELREHSARSTVLGPRIKESFSRVS